MKEFEHLPQYRSHKIVRALKIKAIMNPNEGIPQEDNGERIMTFEDDGFEAAAFLIEPEYFQKHRPRIGGYFVVYEDGYKSWSPAEVFENGHTRI